MVYPYSQSLFFCQVSIQMLVSMGVHAPVRFVGIGVGPAPTKCPSCARGLSIRGCSGPFPATANSTTSNTFLDRGLARTDTCVGTRGCT